VRSRASSFKWEYPLLSLRSSSSFLRLLPRLPLASNSPFIFHSITCFRRQFLRKMWPIHFAFRFLFHLGYSSFSYVCCTMLSAVECLYYQQSIFSEKCSFSFWNITMLCIVHNCIAECGYVAGIRNRFTVYNLSPTYWKKRNLITCVIWHKEWQEYGGK